MRISLKQKELSENSQVSYLTFQLHEPLVFKEGQFVMLSRQISWKTTRRAYSIVSTLEETQKNEEICFLVKKVSENGMSNYLTQEIKEWDSLDMTWPYWHFTDNKSHNKYLLISVGSGRAATIPIYKHLVNEEKRYSKIVNLFGERTLQDVPKTIADIYSQSHENVLNISCFSRDININNDIIKPCSIIKKWHVQDGLSQALEFLESTKVKVFICWLPKMADEMQQVLIDKWVPKNNFIIEKY